MNRRVGVVLAGGVGKRMGQPKGSLAWGGMTLAQRAARALEPLCAEVYVSVAPGAVSPAPLARTIEDPSPAGRGPLAGLGAAFATAGEADLVVLACDYPFVETSFCRSIVAAAEAEPGADVVFPVDSSGRDHPLVGLWRKGSRGAPAEALGRGEHSVRAVFGFLRVRRLTAADFGVPTIDGFLENWNTPADWRASLRADP